MRHLVRLAAALIMLTIVAGGTTISLAATPTPTTETLTIPDYLISHRLPPNVRELVRAGNVWQAIQRLQDRAATFNETWPREEAEHLQWLQRDYSLTADAMLAKIRESIPDATRADLDEWTRTREIQWLAIDGDVRYFRREPSNLWRFSKSARARRDEAAKKSPSSAAGDPVASAATSSPLDLQIQAAVNFPRVTDSPLLLPSYYKVRHTLTVKPGVVPAGQAIRCWLPLPREYRQQTAARDLVTTPAQHRISADASVHNTVYMEQPSAGDLPTTFAAEYSYTNHAWAPRITTATIDALPDKPAADMSRYLREEPPHIAFSPGLRQLAATIIGNERNPYRKAERIFRWMDANIRYCSEMEYSTIASASEKILQTRRGDCGVQAILFIALCRTSGVPARWQSGWATQPKHWNMHDWAEFYVEPLGWLPADPSIGFRKLDNLEMREFLFGHIDAYRMIANSGICAPFDPPKQHHRSDPVDSQRGEVETDSGNLYFDQWDYKVDIFSHVEPPLPDITE